MERSGLCCGAAVPGGRPASLSCRPVCGGGPGDRPPPGGPIGSADVQATAVAVLLHRWPCRPALGGTAADARRRPEPHQGFGKERDFVAAILKRLAPRIEDALAFALENRVLLVKTKQGVDVGSSRIPHFGPVDSLPVFRAERCAPCGRQDPVDDELHGRPSGASISSARQAAYARASPMSSSSR